MSSVINGPGMLTVQLAILILTLIQTVGVIIILLKLNLSLRDFFSLSSPIVRNHKKDQTQGTAHPFNASYGATDYDGV